MRRPLVLLSLPLLMLAAACAQTGSTPTAAGGATSPDHRWEGFSQRATEAAEAWRPDPTWTRGYVPLEGPTVLTGDPRFTPDTELAYQAGWYRAQVPLPGGRPADGTIRFPDGTLTVPLVSAADAYRELDQGDPPPCEERPQSPPPRTKGGPTIEPGPDGWVTGPPQSACTPLTITAVRLDTAPVRTSRGEARVPAWLFTVQELAVPVARLAVAPQATGAAPEGSTPQRGAPDGVVGAQDLQEVDGDRVTYRLGVGACDTGITPLVQERDDVVVVGGGVTRASGICTDQLKLAPVTVTLKAPLGARPVLDVLTGAPLRLAPR
ncbi:hypothetical protein ACFOOK_27030 [Micromonospora krabiensis]|uniref:Lipoprotein n=1 Tax=Micromonospora krabiensis TaxID=307121 RepID=A0A1C3N5C9_9ACTN|nr:hypothetical protein [Micromonospora krabiensis]SBV27778.1 hypothetical protein GA0070620_3307 [Micromonospora krabiensis]